MKKLKILILLGFIFILSACTLSKPKTTLPNTNDKPNTNQVVNINNNTNQNTNEVVNNNPNQYIGLGEEFTLHKNQLAIVKNTDHEITITQFFNSPCPDGAMCLWSGVGITFKHTFKGEVREGLNLLQAFGYQTTIIDTDHETYAKLKINLPKNTADLTSCQTDADCVAATCCHPTSVVNKNNAPDCTAIACDMSCQVPLDCGGAKIACQNNKCTVVITK